VENTAALKMGHTHISSKTARSIEKKMSEKLPITTKQLKLLQAEFKRLQEDGDPRANGPRGEVFPATREGRIEWATAHLGKRITTFNALSIKEGEYLIDTLTKGLNDTKIDGFIAKEFQRMGVERPAEYFAAMLAQGNKWKYGGRDLASLNRFQKCMLANTLSTRGASPRRHYAPAPTRGVNEEQSTLWGL
jgi:hypothetical protein